MSNLKAPDVWADRGTVTVWVVGAGGNGGEVIDALAQFSLALKALGGPELEVTIIDDAKVREVNLVRQRFWAGDVGAFKSITLANRYNLLLGMRWQGVPGRLEDVAEELSSAPDILITAVDLASTRRWVGSHRWRCSARSPLIWLDLGNNARNGQAILGSFGGEGHPTVLDHYPEIEGMADDTTKSCSTAEAIAAQDCLVNRAVATAGMSLIWELLRHGSTRKNGIVIDLASGQQIPIAFPTQSIMEASP